MIEIVFLGTSSMMPTKDRNHSAVFMKVDKLSVLFDCGEGTQRQLKFAKIKPSKIDIILLSHWHGDHVLGLSGLLQTIAASVEYKEDKKIIIIGPKGTKEKIGFMMKAFPFQDPITLEIVDVSKDGVCYENNDVFIEAYFLEHSVPCIGFSFNVKDKISINKRKLDSFGIKEGPELKKLKNCENITVNGITYDYHDLTTVKKGKKIGYAVDTRPCNGLVRIAKNCNLLITEATYADKQEDKARDNFHMTGSEAAIIASQNNVDKLVITHFSQRYKSSDEILSEAKVIFPETRAAYDFMRIRL